MTIDSDCRWIKRGYVMDGVSFLLTLLVTFLLGIATGHNAGKKEGYAKGKEDGIKENQNSVDKKKIEEAFDKVPGFPNLSKEDKEKNVKLCIDGLNKKPAEPKPADTEKPTAGAKEAVRGDNASLPFVLLLVIAGFVIWSIFFG